MDKPCIEYISACSCCEVFRELVEELEHQYAGKVHVKVYHAGKDFDYISKYGNVSKSMLVINEKKAVTNLTKPAVRKAFEEAVS